MSLPWDVAKDIAFALSSLGLFSWMLARYRATHLEFSTSYAGLFQSANEAFLIFDEAGTIVDANHKACALYGYPVERMNGLTDRRDRQDHYEAALVPRTGHLHPGISRFLTSGPGGVAGIREVAHHILLEKLHFFSIINETVRAYSRLHRHGPNDPARLAHHRH